MRIDPSIRHSILQALARDRDAYVDGSQLAEELGVDADLLEAYVDVMDEQGEVKVSKYLGGNWTVNITSRGYLEARGSDDGPPGEAAAADKLVSVLLEPGEARDRLQEQLQRVQKLLARRRRPLTLGEVEEWKGWTETVVRRTYGEKSRQLADFQAVMEGWWPGPAPNVPGYVQRLPRWQALLKTWVREMDEFGPGAPVGVYYIRAGSHLDAYVQLKDTVEQASASVVVVDPYVDDSTLQPLLSVKRGVSIRLLTVKPSKDFAYALERFREQWGGNIEARKGTKELHDRFLLVDGRVFFSGASFKDLGQRGSMIDEIRSDTVKNAVKKDVETSWKEAQPIT